MIDQLNGTCGVLFALDESLFFQGLQVAHDTVGRLDLEFQTDFPHGRAVAAALNLGADELVNLALPFRQLAEVRHGHLLWRLRIGIAIVIIDTYSYCTEVY